MEPRGLEESTFPFRPWRRLPFARSHGPLKSLQTIDLMLIILAINTCFFTWFPLVFHGVTIAELDTGFNLEATDEANEFVERLVHVHPVLGRALDERGLQLLRHVFAVRCRHLKAISSELYSMQRIFLGCQPTLIGIFLTFLKGHKHMFQNRRDCVWMRHINDLTD